MASQSPCASLREPEVRSWQATDTSNLLREEFAVQPRIPNRRANSGLGLDLSHPEELSQAPSRFADQRTVRFESNGSIRRMLTNTSSRSANSTRPGCCITSLCLSAPATVSSVFSRPSGR